MKNCIVPADEVVERTLLTFCQDLVIAGRVEANVIGIGLRTNISREVGRNVYLVGLELDLIGKLSRDLHFVCLTKNLASPTEARHKPVHGQVIFASLSAHVGATVIVPSPITGLGYQQLLDGQVRGEINFWGLAFVLNSVVFGDVNASVGNPASEATDLENLLLPVDVELSVVTPGLAIASTARIHGQLEYYGPSRQKSLASSTERSPIIRPHRP